MAEQASVNRRVYIADGIRVDGVDRLKMVVDHLNGAAHEAALAASRLCHQWQSQQSSHPWIAIQKKYRADVLSVLVELATDVYNDSLVETPTAWSWPSRSLAAQHSRRVMQMMDASTPFTPTQPSGSNLLYRTPDMYREMLEVVGAIEAEKLGRSLSECVVYSIQVDGSVDRQAIDNKFVTARLMREDGTLETVILGVEEPESLGANGLLEAVKSSLGRAGAPLEKLVGITTDGESANTGRRGGLWRLLADYSQRQLLTIWCVCHRSDLAMESVESAVVEVVHWKRSLRSVATFFRTSGTRSKRLREQGGTVKFPAFLEVRFSQHLLALISAVLKNLPACRSVWEETHRHDSGENRSARTEAAGFLRQWKPGGRLMRITRLMGDVCEVVCHLQKTLQCSGLILPQVLEARDSAVTKLKMMQDGLLPGGLEEDDEDEPDQDAHATARRVINSNVSFNREFEAVRTEIVQSTINFLDERLDIEQERTVKTMEDVLAAQTAAEFVRAGEAVVRDLFPKDVTQFTHDVTDRWRAMEAARRAEHSGEGRLRAMTMASTGVCKRLLASFVTLTPHSMATERAVSHYNNIRSHHRLAMSNKTVNARLIIALNGVGTAHYDPRPAVCSFLEKKGRRIREPEPKTYQSREFVAKFFRESGDV